MNTTEFCKKTNISEDQFFGVEICGSLYLSGLTSIPDGFNPTVGGYLYLDNLASIPDGFNPTVGSSLDLGGLTSIPDGFNPTVGSSLDLGGLTSIPDGFNPNVGGNLDLRGLTSIPDGFNPNVGGSLDLGGLTSIPDGFNPTVGGSLDLGGLTSIPDGFNPTVGGYLYLSGLTSIPDGFNPTVGGFLDLGGLTSIPDGFNPTVGGYLYLGGSYSENKNPPQTDLIFFQGGAYLKADGIFARVIQCKKSVYRLCKLNSEKEFWMVTDGKFTHAHGDTMKSAKESFQFKIESERIKSESITSDTLIMIQHYRIITGACEFGIKDWIEQNIPQTKRASILKNGIKAKDLLPILEKTDAYGLARFKALLTS